MFEENIAIAKNGREMENKLKFLFEFCDWYSNAKYNSSGTKEFFNFSIFDEIC